MKKTNYVVIVIFFLISVESLSQNLSLNKLYKIARKAPDSIKADKFEIVDYFKTKTENPKELVLLFVYWITQNISYDVEKSHISYFSIISAWETLEKRKTICGGYAELLSELCYWADIECEIIRGYTKGIDYNGKPIEDPNHVWNAVLINNKWELIDVTWASGFVSVKNKSLVFNKLYNYKYVFAKPEYLIKTHFPIDSRWQLLDRPISINTFYIEFN
ncbi:MAG: transglutaminase domain-containing protein [Flavobacteriaceae bacterium]|nr:transglutaminase domain-containing protein [Flavobacteriaceae bacterium]